MLGLEHETLRGAISIEYYGRNVGIKIMPTGEPCRQHTQWPGRVSACKSISLQWDARFSPGMLTFATKQVEAKFW